MTKNIELEKLKARAIVAKKAGLIGKNYDVEKKTKANLNSVLKELDRKSANTTKRINQAFEKTLTKDEKKITIKLTKNQTILNVLRAILPVNTGNLYPVMEYNGMYYTLSKKKVINLIKALSKGDKNDLLLNQIEYVQGTGSDTEVLTVFTGENMADEVVIEFRDLVEDARQVFKKQYSKYAFVDEPRGNKKQIKIKGAFFPFNHKLDFDLSRYQIYKEDVEETENYDDRYKDCCFVHVLNISKKLTEPELISIKLMVKNNCLPFTKIRELCTKLNFGIILHRMRDDKIKTRIEKINPESDRQIEMGLLENHYFLIEQVRITSYSINNYDKVKDIKGWNKIEKKRNEEYKQSNKKFITSFKLITLLLNNKELLIPIKYDDRLLNTALFKDYECDYNNLNYCDNAVEEIIYKKGFDKVKQQIVSFDFETTTDGDKHIPYMLCSETEKGIKRTFKGDNLVIDFLNTLDNNTLCYAHNLGYDIRFIISKLNHVKKVIQKSESKIICLNGSYNNKNLSFKCSYAMINSPLKDFSDMFNIKSKKEVMPYKIFSRENITKDKILIKDAIECLEKEEDKKDMLININEWNLKDGEYFDHIKYSELYCIQDVSLMKQGMIIFNEWCDKLDMNILDYMTLASLSDSYLKKNGCYEGTYKISSIVRDFIQKCVVGGRTMCKNNEKDHCKHAISDFDAVSLYPSAMVRLATEIGGFLKGKPKVLEKVNCNYDFLKQQDGYFVKINVLEVNKRRDFPLINKMVEGIRMFDNGLKGEMFVDKITLEDLIKFQDVKFEVVCGYYFNEGRNNKIGEVMTFLFNKRVELKKKENPAQAIYKLLMNSSYGKSCLKPIDSEVQIMEEERFYTYLKENYIYISYYCKIPNSNLYKVKSSKPIMEHFNSCHIGTEILSMSKRMMNEVMCLAEDIDIKIHYQDTDSMQINNDKIEKLSKAYKAKYNKDLIGEDMGQFHTDFEKKTQKYNNLKEIKNFEHFKADKEPIAVESIYLGKKSYIDKVKLEFKGRVEYGYHMRMKGIPHKCLNLKIKEKFKGDPMKMYKHLYDGKPIEFNLLEGSVNFQAMPNYDIRNRIEFKRNIVFKRK